ncbi:hypothetical protein [Lactiplantibacillus paraxiangfangensis]|uniref:hypothetical protein n=1 Tax=Lactiplantibacillus paraxiangfangensis TaxID=3076224 RepID=UPI0030C66703
MATVLYYWDKETKELDHSELYMNESDVPKPLPDNATTVAPENGLYEPIHISDDKTKWLGTSKEEWLAAHPVPTPEPTAEQKMIMQQATGIAQLQQLAMSQASQIAILSKGDSK